MTIPLVYNPLTKVVPSDPDRLPYIPVQVLYLIAQALPRPSQVFNLARVNKATWEYLQPALYECEVTYEARLVAHFGDGFTNTPSPPGFDNTGSANGDDEDRSDTDDDEDPSNSNEDQNAERNLHCAHGLVTALCEVCGQRIAIAKKDFKTCLTIARGREPLKGNSGKLFFKSRGMTALHWACVQGEMALPVARKAIEAAKTHQSSYIDGRGLRPRRYEAQHGQPLFGEIPPPLFTAVAFGNTKLCVVLVEAGCNVNLVQAMDISAFFCRRWWGLFFRIHDSCAPCGIDDLICQWEGTQFGRPTCTTVGHVALAFGRIDILEYLLDCGLDPLMGKEPLIHRAARMCRLSAVRAVLHRYPAMAYHLWDGLTPLHSLCDTSNSNGIMPLEKLKSVATYLVQKGASLEGEGSNTTSRVYNFQSGFTPLQYVLQFFTDTNCNKLHAPVALIMLGANWDRPVVPFGAPNTRILDHCVRHATYDTKSQRMCGQGPIEHSLSYAKLIKAIVENTWGSIPDPALAPGSERAMQPFLGAFRMLAGYATVTIPMRLNRFAIEAVGRLLLSTGIHPDRGAIETWETAIAENAEGQGAHEWAASPWKGLIADLPSATPAPML